MSKRDAYAAFVAALIQSLERDMGQHGGATGLRALFAVFRRPKGGAA